MKMDYSVAKQFGSKISDNKVSTEEIKAGLQRIKKAQQQVLQQLKKNHPDYSIDVRTSNSQMYRVKSAQNQNLKRQLNIQRQKSTQKSTLYRRRVIDLESSLTLHAQHEQKLKSQLRILEEENKALQSENRILHQQIRQLKNKYGDLERDYQKLMEESQKSNKNLRGLERQVMDFNNKIQEDDVKGFRAQFQAIKSQRNTIMAEKVALLKNYSKLQSQNIQLKMKITSINKQHLQQKKSLVEQQQARHKQKLKQMEIQLIKSQVTGKQKQGKIQGYNPQQINTILAQINKMNSSHEYIFTTLKSSTKLSKLLIDKENLYQNSLNKVLEIIHRIQRNQTYENGLLQYKFDHQQSFKEDLHRIQLEFAKRHKKQMLKYNTQKQQLTEKLNSKQKKLQQIEQQRSQLQQKLIQVRKQKTQLLQQMAQLNKQIQEMKQNSDRKQKEGYYLHTKKQQENEEQYRTIIKELNQQMNTIQKQKRDLDGLVRGMANNKSQEDGRNKKKLNEIIQKNNQIRNQNQNIKSKYQVIFLQKQHLFLSLNQVQNKNNTLTQEIARQVLQKEKLIGQLARIKQQKDITSLQLQKYRLLSENMKKQAEGVNNKYIMEIQRLIYESLVLRKQIQELSKDRNQLRELKGKYGLLMKDAQLLGKQVKQVNHQLDHLWMVKQVQYGNVNKIVNQLKPL